MALSELTYKPDAQIRSALANKKNLEVHNSKLAGVAYAFYEDDNYQRIGIQGSESACEWSLDLDSSLISEPALYGMKFHKGFLDVAKEIRQTVLQSLPRSSSKPIIITGHSLGGALSTLLALLLVYDGYKIDSVITFGQPQITDRAGAELFNKHFANQFKLLRVINQNDMIPHFLWILNNSYAQFGSEMRIEQTPKSKLMFALLEIPDGSPWTGELNFSKVSDHLIGSYQQSLATLFSPLGVPCQGYQSGQL